MHIEFMKIADSKHTPKKTKIRRLVLGRSAATGTFVLTPASRKGAKITMKEANTAVQFVSNMKVSKVSKTTPLASINIRRVNEP